MDVKRHSAFARIKIPLKHRDPVFSLIPPFGRWFVENLF